MEEACEVCSHQEIFRTTVADSYTLHGLYLNEALQRLDVSHATLYGATLRKHALQTAMTQTEFYHNSP